jgi:23S rRNA (guanosine2251-2'-O)-methyltransferase
LGRAARSAFAFGADLLVIPKDRSAEVTAIAEKTAVGCLARIPVARVTNLNRALDDLKQAGLWVLGTSDKASKAAWKVDMKGPTALVIGNEEKGLRKGVAESCDELVQIPMQSPDMSLNAADALTVLLYEVLRQRRA